MTITNTKFNSSVQPSTFVVKIPEEEELNNTGNSKLHKPNTPLRLIVSSINSPTRSIASIITGMLNRAYNKDNSFYTGDRYSFTDFMKNKTIPARYKIVSL